MKAPRMAETPWQRDVIQIAETFGWRVMHVRKAIGRRDGVAAYQTPTSIDGWPDLLLWSVRRPERGLVALELKGDGGKATAEQEQVLAELAAAGVRTMVAWPKDVDAVIALLRS